MLHRGLSYRHCSPPTVGTLPSGQRKLDHTLERNSPCFLIAVSAGTLTHIQQTSKYCFHPSHTSFFSVNILPSFTLTNFRLSHPLHFLLSLIFPILFTQPSPPPFILSLNYPIDYPRFVIETTYGFQISIKKNCPKFFLKNRA